MTPVACFCCLAAALAALAGAAIAGTVLRARGPVTVRSDLPALAAARRELEAALASGRIDRATWREDLEELRRQALAGDTAAAGTDDADLARRRLTAALLMLFVILGAVALYGRLGSPRDIQLFSELPRGGLLNYDGSLSHPAAQPSPEQFERYLSRHAGDGRLWLLYARRLANAGRWTEARDAYAKVVAGGGRAAAEPGLALEYAASCFRTGTAEGYEQGCRILAEAIAADPGDTRARQLLIMASLDSGRWGVAREQLERLLEIIDRDDPAWENLAFAAAEAAARERAAAQRPAP